MTDWPKLATSAVKHGLAVIAVQRINKRPFGEWAPYKDRLPTVEELASMFDGRNGDASMAVCTGTGSQMLEAIDFEDYRAPVFEEWKAILTENGFGDVLERLVVQKSGRGGRHVFYRCTSCEGNQKLARTEDKECLIETRGLGGYILIAPSEGYTLLQGRFSKIPQVTPEERHTMLTVARLLNQYIEPQKVVRHERSATGSDMRPGDDFNLRGRWDFLTGWKDAGRKVGGFSAWRRLGSDNAWGATTGVRANGEDMLYVFTSSAPPFEPDHGYSKFSAYTLLHHGGDSSAAAKALAKEGYGQPAARNVREWEAQASGTKTMREMRQEDRAAKYANVKSIDDYEEEETSFLIEPYIRNGQINLLDAKGASGKTTMCLAIAAAGSLGVTPMGGPCEPWRTLYFHKEDSPQEMKQVYRNCGGIAGDWLIPWTTTLELDPDGLMELDDMIGHFKPSLIVFDAITHYLPRYIKAAHENIAIEKVLTGLRDVVRGHGIACLNIRHFKQGTKGLGIEDWGTGGEVWRNSHRSQMVMVPHASKPRTSAVFHTKGSLVSASGAPFGYTFEAGEFAWMREINPADYGVEENRYTRHKAGTRGPQPAKTQAAIDALTVALSRGPQHYHNTKDSIAKAVGCDERTVRDAAKILGITYDRPSNTWGLPEGFDAFEEPGQGSQGGTPRWFDK